jgi:hypothetical protein
MTTLKSTPDAFRDLSVFGETIPTSRSDDLILLMLCPSVAGDVNLSPI